MRIPSNFSDQSLYQNRRRGRRESSQSMRRVVRLVLALGVVLLVMYQAANPGLYKPFFPGTTTLPVATPASPGSPARNGSPEPNGTPSTPANASAVASDSSRGTKLPPPPSVDPASVAPANVAPANVAPANVDPTAEDRDRIARLDATGQQRLTRWLAHWRRVSANPPSSEPPQGLPQEPASEPAKEANEPGASAGEEVAAQRSLDALFAAIESQVPRFDSPEAAALLAAVQPRTRMRLQRALDETYQSRVVDGAIWRGADSDAFYRYLEMATAENFAEAFLSADPPPQRVGVLPLLQQPQQYLGHAVWLSGSVARAVPVSATDNPFGIQEYWEIWVRPEDGTERAVIFYTPSVPKTIAAVGPQATLQHGPRVAIAGRFLKRRLFGAVGGATESPVVVGSIWQRARPADVAQNAPLDRRRLWMVVALAGIIGLGVAGLLLWRSSVTAKQMRRVRTSATALPKGFADAIETGVASEAAQKPDASHNI